MEALAGLFPPVRYALGIRNGGPVGDVLRSRRKLSSSECIPSRAAAPTAGLIVAIKSQGKLIHLNKNIMPSGRNLMKNPFALTGPASRDHMILGFRTMNFFNRFLHCPGPQGRGGGCHGCCPAWPCTPRILSKASNIHFISWVAVKELNLKPYSYHTCACMYICIHTRIYAYMCMYVCI